MKTCFCCGRAFTDEAQYYKNVRGYYCTDSIACLAYQLAQGRTDLEVIMPAVEMTLDAAKFAEVLQKQLGNDRE
jgi:hypothetical protein